MALKACPWPSSAWACLLQAFGGLSSPKTWYPKP